MVWSVWGVYRRDVRCLLSGQGVVGIDVMSGACGLVSVGVYRREVGCMRSGQGVVGIYMMSGAYCLVRMGVKGGSVDDKSINHYVSI